MMLWKQKGFLTSARTPIKSGQQVQEFLDALLLPSEMAVIKTGAHANRDNVEAKGNAVPGRFAKQAASTKVLILTSVQRINLWTESRRLLLNIHT